MLSEQISCCNIFEVRWSFTHMFGCSFWEIEIQCRKNNRKTKLNFTNLTTFPFPYIWIRRVKLLNFHVSLGRHQFFQLKASPIRATHTIISLFPPPHHYLIFCLHRHYSLTVLMSKTAKTKITLAKADLWLPVEIHLFLFCLCFLNWLSNGNFKTSHKFSR